MRILVTRPAADADEFKSRLTALGHDVLVDPLMLIESCAPRELNAEGVAAVVATSRNAIRAIAGHGALRQFVRLPLYTVGPGTAEAARALGFGDIRQGGGTAAELVAPIAAQAGKSAGTVLHLRGERTAFDLAGALAGLGVRTGETIVYRQVQASSLSASTVSALSHGKIDVIMLMSPLTAATWLSLVEAPQLRDAAAGVRYACLSAGVARAIASLGAETHVAAKPSAEEMLALIAGLAAQSPGSRAAAPEGLH